MEQFKFLTTIINFLVTIITFIVMLFCAFSDVVTKNEFIIVLMFFFYSLGNFIATSGEIKD